MRKTDADYAIALKELAGLRMDHRSEVAGERGRHARRTRSRSRRDVSCTSSSDSVSGGSSSRSEKPLSKKEKKKKARTTEGKEQRHVKTAKLLYELLEQKLVGSAEDSSNLGGAMREVHVKQEAEHDDVSTTISRHGGELLSSALLLHL